MIIPFEVNVTSDGFSLSVADEVLNADQRTMLESFGLIPSKEEVEAGEEEEEVSKKAELEQQFQQVSEELHALTAEQSSLFIQKTQLEGRLGEIAEAKKVHVENRNVLAEALKSMTAL